jgi:uncharacterized protein (TIGR00725 family)
LAHLITAMRQPITIAVCGAGTADPETAARAEDVGRAVAEQDARLVCGGLGGVMAAACRGAKKVGGLTIGILPGRQSTDANQWVDIPLATGLAEGRNLLIIYNADGVIALPGGSGTLSEIALALKTGKPIVDLGDWGIAGMIPGTGDISVMVAKLIQEIKRRNGDL